MNWPVKHSKPLQAACRVSLVPPPLASTHDSQSRTSGSLPRSCSSNSSLPACTSLFGSKRESVSPFLDPTTRNPSNLCALLGIKDFPQADFPSSAALAEFCRKPN
jgi:hypothetical protein